MHPLEQIRQALKTQLEAVPALRGRVYVERFRPFSSAQLPACVIFTREEVPVQKFARWQETRQVPAEIQLVVLGDEPRLELDDLRAAIEQCLAANKALEDVCDQVEYAGVRFEYDADGEHITGSAILRFDIRYTYEPMMNPADIVPFAGATVEVRPQDAGLPSTLQIELPQ